jgi:predicted CoA-binding protein
MSRKDVMELGELIDDGEAALVVVGESKLEAYIGKAIKKADKQIWRQIEMDRKEFEKELKEAAKAAE